MKGQMRQTVLPRRDRRMIAMEQQGSQAGKLHRTAVHAFVLDLDRLAEDRLVRQGYSVFLEDGRLACPARPQLRPRRVEGESDAV